MFQSYSTCSLFISGLYVCVPNDVFQCSCECLLRQGLNVTWMAFDVDGGGLVIRQAAEDQKGKQQAQNLLAPGHGNLESSVRHCPGFNHRR